MSIHEVIKKSTEHFYHHALWKVKACLVLKPETKIKIMNDVEFSQKCYLLEKKDP